LVCPIFTIEIITASIAVENVVLTTTVELIVCLPPEQAITSSGARLTSGIPPERVLSRATSQLIIARSTVADNGLRDRFREGDDVVANAGVKLDPDDIVEGECLFKVVGRDDERSVGDGDIELLVAVLSLARQHLASQRPRVQRQHAGGVERGQVGLDWRAADVIPLKQVDVHQFEAIAPESNEPKRC